MLSHWSHATLERACLYNTNRRHKLCHPSEGTTFYIQIGRHTWAWVEQKELHVSLCTGVLVVACQLGLTHHGACQAGSCEGPNEMT